MNALLITECGAVSSVDVGRWPPPVWRVPLTPPVASMIVDDALDLAKLSDVTVREREFVLQQMYESTPVYTENGVPIPYRVRGRLDQYIDRSSGDGRTASYACVRRSTHEDRYAFTIDGFASVWVDVSHAIYSYSCDISELIALNLADSIAATVRDALVKRSPAVRERYD